MTRRKGELTIQKIKRLWPYSVVVPREVFDCGIPFQQRIRLWRLGASRCSSTAGSSCGRTLPMRRKRRCSRGGRAHCRRSRIKRPSRASRSGRIMTLFETRQLTCVPRDRTGGFQRDRTWLSSRMIIIEPPEKSTSNWKVALPEACR